MRRTQFSNKQLEKEKLERKIIRLMDSATDKIDPDDLLQLFYDNVLNSTQREYLRDKMASILQLEGVIVINCNELVKREKIREFMETEIAPYYNEQTNQILF